MQLNVGCNWLSTVFVVGTVLFMLTPWLEAKFEDNVCSPHFHPSAKGPSPSSLLNVQVKKAVSGGSQALSETDEMEIIVRAVCATKLPTLTFDDTR